MSTFKAVLTQPISYIDISGRARSIPAGTTLFVSQVTRPTVSITEHGKIKQERPGAFIGAHGDDSFDLGHEEFAAIN
jgi:hypothetical protein